MDYSIKVGAEAGGGIQTISDSLGRVFSRMGYHVFVNQDYESRIRGGHNFFQLRFSDKPVIAPRERINILIALDKASVPAHEREVLEDGHVVYDSETLKTKYEGPRFLDVPFVKLATDSGGSRVMANTVAVGAVLGMLGIDLDLLEDSLKTTFHDKGEDVVNANIRAARAGRGFAVRECEKCAFSPAPRTEPKMLVSGVDAIGFGAIASGCKFYSAYPMTPSTGIMLFLAGKAKDYGIIVEQAEDEIAAINMIIGASFAGVRSMTATSGGGFALMVEGLSLAAMTETPVVIGLGQRPGPATGLPTRTEQGELLFALHAGHGEFPRVVFAPGTPEEAFFLTNKAFDLAEKYQIPAVILFDHFLADSVWTFDRFDLSRLVYTDYRLRGEEFSKLPEYKRHAYTDTGVTPLGVPGDSKHLVVTDSDEHGEEGHIIEDASIRVKMVEKRLLKKLPLVKDQISPPSFYGDENPDILITGWGSTYGVIKEVVDILSKNRSVALLHFTEVHPFPLISRFDYIEKLCNAKLTICVENNATGQFERLMNAETGYSFRANIHKYDGRPFLVEGLLGEIDAHIGRL